MGIAGRNQIAVALGIALSSALLVGGCVTAYKGLRFSHRAHRAEAECADCHQGANRAGHEQCASCHDIDQAAPSAACLTCHTEGDYRVEAARPKGYRDLIFDHDVHAEEACARCHTGAEKSGRAADSNLPAMKVCSTCHDGNQASAECGTCHEAVRADRAPADHTSLWPRQHGKAARSADTTCSYCHRDTACFDCHTTERPTSHTPAWNQSKHGIAADHDREACATCHRADACQRCHRQRPASHFGAGFRLPTNPNMGHAGLVDDRGGPRSCRVCHQRSFCLECHPGGF